MAGTPLFKRADINFENGKKLVINAPGNNAGTRYVQSVSFNGKAYTKNYFNHSDILNGGVINVQMSTKPNKQRGTTPADYPYSLSKE